MESRLRHRNQLALFLVAMLLGVGIPAALAQVSDPGKCAPSPALRDKGATRVWTDQGVGSAFVLSQAECDPPGPFPAAVRPAGPACVLWDSAPAQQQFGDVIGGLISGSQQQGQQPEAGPPTVPMIQMCDGSPTGVVWVTPQVPCPPGDCPLPVTPRGTAVAL